MSAFLDLHRSPKEGASGFLCPSVEAWVLLLLGAQLRLLESEEENLCAAALLVGGWS